ncbi:MAG: hypothetical protein ACREQ9_06525 [Candidatus Binatia bacterium]
MVSRTRRLPSLQLDVLGGESLTPLSFEFEKGVFADTAETGPIPS